MAAFPPGWMHSPEKPPCNACDPIGGIFCPPNPGVYYCPACRRMLYVPQQFEMKWVFKDSEPTFPMPHIPTLRDSIMERWPW